MNISTVDTLDQLKNLPVGTAVRVNDSAWERVEQGLKREEYVVSLANLAGEISIGNVTLDMAPQVGQVYLDNTVRAGAPAGPYDYLVLTHEEGAVYWTAVMNKVGEFVRVERITGQPPGTMASGEFDHAFNVPLVMSIAAPLARATVATTGLREQLNSMTQDRDQRKYRSNQELVEYQTRLQEALWTYLDDHEYDDNSTLEELMVDHGMLARVEDVAVTIYVDGATEVYLEADELDGYVPNDCTVSTSVEFAVRWSTTLRQILKAHGCACNQVSRDMIKELLDAADIACRASDIDWEVSCAND